MEIELVDIKTGETVLKWALQINATPVTARFFAINTECIMGTFLPGTLFTTFRRRKYISLCISIQIGTVLATKNIFGDYVQSDGLG